MIPVITALLPDVDVTELTKMKGDPFWDKYAKYIASTKLFKEKDHKKMITEGGWAILEKV